MRQYHFRLYPESDQDLIDWLDTFPPGRKAFEIVRILRRALLEEKHPGAVDYDKIKAAVKAAVLEALEERRTDLKAAIQDAVETTLTRMVQPKEPRRWLR